MLTTPVKELISHIKLHLYARKVKSKSAESSGQITIHDHFSSVFPMDFEQILLLEFLLLSLNKFLLQQCKSTPGSNPGSFFSGSHCLGI